MEQIFAVPTQLVMETLPMGLAQVSEEKLLNWVATQATLHPRTEALENDPTLMQLVAYVMVECQGKILFYQRAPKGDKRIQGKYSIAFGGHINHCDHLPGMNPVIAGRSRELAEEVTLAGAPRFKFLGTLNINLAPIDRFHLGCVYQAQVDNPSYVLNEPEAFAWSHWASPEEVAAKYEVLESWSAYLFKEIYPYLVPANMLAART